MKEMKNGVLEVTKLISKSKDGIQIRILVDVF